MEYDVIVLGGGAGGLTASIGCVKAGKKVLLVEKKQIGGECTWSGCIPSKAFIHAASKTKDSGLAFQIVREKIQEVYAHETPEVLSGMGIDVVIGEAKFTGKQSVSVNGKEYTGKNIVLSTGSSPLIPQIPGLEEVDYLSNESFFLLEKAPESIIFLGGGVISIELSLPLVKLGTKVTILEKAPALLGFEEPEIGGYISEKLAASGLNIRTGVEIESISKTANGTKISYKRNGASETVEAERIFISAGRKPNVEGLNLEKAGVKYSGKGVEVNSHMQAADNIYAVGDVTGPYRFSHMAGYQGEIAVQNILLPLLKKKADYSSVPWITFSEPEYSRTGMTEKEAVGKYGEEIKVYKLDEKNDRSIASLEEKFLLKVICHKGKIVGATCLGNRAGEIMGILQLLKSQEIPFYKYRESIQAYPTYADMIKKLATQAYSDHLKENPILGPLINMYTKKGEKE